MIISNNADTVKIIDTRLSGIMTTPNVVLETANGSRLNLPYSWEDLDKIDEVNNMNKKNNGGKI